VCVCICFFVVCVCKVISEVSMCVVCFFINFILLHAPLLCSNTMSTCIDVYFTYFLLLSTYSIYSLASYLPILDYTLHFVQYYVVHKFFEEFYTKYVFIHWPVF